MKIGIMSMQRVCNYGSFLQAYGLKKTIESIDNSAEVSFVDYKVEKAVEALPKKKNNVVFRVLRMFSPTYRKYRNEQIRMGASFHEFINAYNNSFLPKLGITEQRKECSELDILVIGSDEVFNCTQKSNEVGFSRQLFGKDHHAKILVSYAASFGSTTLEKLRQYQIDSEIKELLMGFNALSVRDHNSLEVVGHLTGMEPEYHIDPVLVYEFPEVREISIDISDYIVVYAYADRLSENEIDSIRQFAKKRNKKILTLGFWQTFSDEYVLADPFEVLAYIKKADFVVTDTFHGTVFSIKYQVPFATIIRESNKQKLRDLLERFNLSNRELENISDLELVLSKELPQKIKDMITEEQKKSMLYLERVLKDCK